MRLPCGSGGTIYFDNLLSITKETTGGGGNEDVNIILGHELFHAYESIGGLLDDTGILQNGASTLIREARAVYFENTVLRPQLGIRELRTSYNGLDASGNPIPPPMPTGIQRLARFFLIGGHPIK